MCKLLLFLLITAGSFINVFSQIMGVDGGGVWRLAAHENRSQTVIAQLDLPATYEVCRKDPSNSTVSTDAVGRLYLVIDGVFLDHRDLDPDSCAVVRGRKIGLRSENLPVKFFQYAGTYRRLNEPRSWSALSSWSYWAQYRTPDIGGTFPIVIGVKGTYRICQGIVVIDGSPDPKEVGYRLYINDTPVQTSPDERDYIRFGRYNCIDVTGTDIEARLMLREVTIVQNYKAEGKFSYLIE